MIDKSWKKRAEKSFDDTTFESAFLMGAQAFQTRLLEELSKEDSRYEKTSIDLVENLKARPEIINYKSRFDKAVEYVQNSYADNHGLEFMMLRNVAELIKICTGREIDHNVLAKYRK